VRGRDIEVEPGHARRLTAPADRIADPMRPSVTVPSASVLQLQRTAGNRAVARLAASGWPARRPAARTRRLARAPTAMMQPGFATGDQFAIAAALIHDPELHVFLSKGPPSGQAGHDPRDKADGIAAFYRASGVPDTRVHVTAVPAMPGYNQLKTAIAGAGLGITKAQAKGISWGTSYVAQHHGEGMRGQLKQAWGVNDSRDTEVAAWLSSKGIAAPAEAAGTRLLVVWSRFSGKKGEIHLEHDTSYEGVRQIVTNAVPHYTAVIIAGDPSYGPGKRQKYAGLAQTVNQTLPAPKAFDLTAFWEDRTPLLTAWGGHDRLGQFKLYDFFQRRYGEVKHLGFRSGNLEALAMLGYSVRYMEEPGSEGGERMAAWHQVDNSGRTRAGGVAPGYERIEVERPPTRSGQYLKQHQAGVRRPAWAPGLAVHEAKPAEAASLPKGFTQTDLTKIKQYLGIPA